MPNNQDYTAEQRKKDLLEAMERWHNSSFSQLSRERDRGIHPTSHDNEYR